MASGKSNLNILQQYREIAKALPKKIKNNIYRYELNIVNSAKTDIKKLHSYINRKQTCKDQVEAIINEDGNRTSNKIEIANAFNNYFKSVFIPDTNEVPDFTQRTTKIMQDDPNIIISRNNIEKRLLALDENKDKVSTR